MRRTHRVVYQLLVGPILEETLDHLCRVRRCVNPEHLEPVSQRVNTLRGETITAMHAAKTECPYGHPYDEENAPVDLRGWRICRACKRKQNRARRARLQAAHPSPEGVLV